MKPANNEKQSMIYDKLINYCKVDISLSDFARIYKNHCNLHLKRAFDDIVDYGRFVDFRKVLDVMLQFPNQNFDSLQGNQLESKRWLIQKMNEMRLQHAPEILIVGGWHGTLALMLKHYAYFAHTVLTTDIDPDCTKIAQIFGCVASTVDMFEIEYDIIPADMIINTSCEHIDFNKWIEMIPKGKMVALQSSDMKEENHIDNIFSIDKFIERAKLSEVYDFDMKTFYGLDQWYSRFLLIGRK